MEVIQDGLEDNKGKGEPIPLSAFRPKEEPDKEKDKISQIEVDPKKKSVDNNQNYNIKNPNFVTDYAAKQTNQSSAPTSSSAFKSNESVEDIRKRLADEEKEEVSKLSPEDFESAAGVIIEILDMSLLFGIRWYSQDISDAEYKVPKEKLDTLKKHLAPLLMRVGKKFPMWVLLLLGVVAAYATPIRKAHEHRKKVIAEKTRKKLLKTESKNSEGAELLDDDKPEYVPLKKKRGGNAK